MENKLKLKVNETLKHNLSLTKGTLGQEEIVLYDIVNQDGLVTGNVKFTDHLSLNGLKRSLHVIQSDISGNVIVDERWKE